MSTLRFLLIIGVFLHPFCGHCFAELRSLSERAEAMASSADTLADAENETTPSKAVCSKAPCVKPTEIDLKPLLADSGTVRVITLLTMFAPCGDFEAAFFHHSQPLYLLLSVFRI